MDQREPPTLRALLEQCSTYMPAADLDLVHAAYTVAARAHLGAQRVSGEPFIEHPLAVARILASLAMDAAGIAAALLHDTVEDTSYTLEEIASRFGPVVAAIVDGVTKFEIVGRDEPLEGGRPPAGVRPTPEQRAHQQQETVRKLLVAMMRDPRVVLLKLADRLHNLRTLDAMSPSQRAAKALETQEIFVPLAAGIGMHLVKSELEDLAFFYQLPHEFERVSRILAQETAARADWARRVCAQVERRLCAEGIVAVVNWRLKHPYRAYLETRDSGMSPADLHDLIAFRVLVETQLDCYRAMGSIHSLWHPMDRIRDYIATPKVNGYRSLHTAVYALDDRRAQFHIRTHAMHRQVQHGVAAHWLERAARGEPVDAALRLAVEDLPGWVAQLDDWHRELRLSAAEFVDVLKRDVFDDQVYVFTPKGDIVELPRGSSALDLAYRIHTDLGDHCAGARVQTIGPGGVPLLLLVPVEYRLQTGDVVTVLTNPAVRAQPEWLESVRTRNAREKVLRALRSSAGAASESDPWETSQPSAESEPELVPPLLHPSGRPAALQLARCCYPCPDDRVAGLPGRGQLITVHRTCCRTLRRTLSFRRQRGKPDGALALDWRAFPPLSYRMAVAVHGQDHAGLMYELALCVKRLGINLSASHATAIQDRHKAIVTLICEFPPAARPEDTLRGLRATPGVTHVERDTRLGCDDTLADRRDVRPIAAPC